MEKTFKKGDHANYDITLTFSTAEQDEAKENMLKQFQKDFEMAGFRKGFAPLDVVEKNTKPEYLAMGIYEHLINKGLQALIKENEKLRLIGEPYDLKEEHKDDKIIFNMKLDVFPEVEVMNNDREKEQLPEIKSAATEKEVEEAIINLKKNYADYQDVDTVALDTISKVEMDFLDKDGKELEKGHNYVGEQEYAEWEFYKKEFIGKKKGDTFTIKYNEKTLPPVYHYKKTEGTAHEVKITIQDIKKMVLPELNEENIEKFFGKESAVKTPAELDAFIKESISHQKFETALVQSIEGLLKLVKGKSMDVVIPKTLIEEEFGSRMKSLEQRFGGQEKMTEYFKKIGEEQGKKFLDDIKSAAKDSLEKFFILQKIVEILKLEINREKPGHLEIEQKVYDKLGKGHDHHHEHSEHWEEVAKTKTKKAKKE